MNLANRLQFTKLKPSKVVVTINNPLADLSIRQTFSRQMLEKSKLAKYSPAKLSRYTVILFLMLTLLWVAASCLYLNMCILNRLFNIE